MLVEGISDRLFFERVFAHLMPDAAKSASYEVVSVGGKGFFAAYKSLLEACHVGYVVIADLDYVTNIGTDEIKKLFSVDESAIRKDVVENPSSVDGASLVARLEEAVSSSDLGDLKILWEYIKARRRKLRTGLSVEERSMLDEFIDERRREGVFILKRGDLESYLPEDFRSKDLDKLIRFLDNPSFLEQVPCEARKELQTITRLIFSEEHSSP